MLKPHELFIVSDVSSGSVPISLVLKPAVFAPVLERNGENGENGSAVEHVVPLESDALNLRARGLP